MIDSRLLGILVCPETKQPVSLADAGLLDRVNEQIAKGSVRSRDGGVVSDKLEAGLVRDDGEVLYPVVEDIPVMLIDAAIPLEGLHG